MVRFLATAALILALGACQSDRGPAGTIGAAVRDPAAAIESFSTLNTGDDRVAKALFGAVTVASAQMSEAIGGYSRGCAAGNVQLPETGPTWQAMRLSRNRNWGQPEVIDFVQDLSRFAATQPGWAGLYVGDIAQPRGGPMLTGHASHQTGLDADIWMLPPDRLNLTRAERENISSISMQRASGAYVNSSWTPQHAAIMRRAAEDPRVARIFVFAGAKVAMCDSATGDRSWLRKIRPWWGHHYHFHVRLSCPANDASCIDQDPIPAGDGCDEARQWQANILNPPPPQPRDPNAPAPAPRREITMATLPGQCVQVLDSN